MKKIGYFIVLTFVAAGTWAQDTIELDTTVIKGNTELPKILYVVPWQDISKTQKSQQTLTLHSLFGDLFEPVRPKAPESFKE